MAGASPRRGQDHRGHRLRTFFMARRAAHQNRRAFRHHEDTASSPARFRRFAGNVAGLAGDPAAGAGQRRFRDSPGRFPLAATAHRVLVPSFAHSAPRPIELVRGLPTTTIACIQHHIGVEDRFALALRHRSGGQRRSPLPGPGHLPQLCRCTAFIGSTIAENVVRTGRTLAAFPRTRLFLEGRRRRVGWYPAVFSYRTPGEPRTSRRPHLRMVRCRRIRCGVRFCHNGGSFRARIFLLSRSVPLRRPRSVVEGTAPTSLERPVGRRSAVGMVLPANGHRDRGTCRRIRKTVSGLRFHRARLLPSRGDRSAPAGLAHRACVPDPRPELSRGPLPSRRHHLASHRLFQRKPCARPFRQGGVGLLANRHFPETSDSHPSPSRRSLPGTGESTRKHDLLQCRRVGFAPTRQNLDHAPVRKRL